MLVVAPNETLAGERRVALVPDAAKLYKKANLDLAIQAGAGFRAGSRRRRVRAREGRRRAGRRRAARARPTSCSRCSRRTTPRSRALRRGCTLISFLRPLDQPEIAAQARRRRRHQLRDGAGAAHHARAGDGRALVAGVARWLSRRACSPAPSLPKVLPMMTTAAGTIPAARVLVIGAGVAGLQAIATARRLGAVVEAYDTRPAVKEQIESLGGRFVELPLDTSDAEGAGGYAKAQSDEFLAKQRELLGRARARRRRRDLDRRRAGRARAAADPRRRRRRHEARLGDRRSRRRHRRQLRAHEGRRNRRRARRHDPGSDEPARRRRARREPRLRAQPREPAAAPREGRRARARSRRRDHEGRAAHARRPGRERRRPRQARPRQRASRCWSTS